MLRKITVWNAHEAEKQGVSVHWVVVTVVLVNILKKDQIRLG